MNKLAESNNYRKQIFGHNINPILEYLYLKLLFQNKYKISLKISLINLIISRWQYFF
jgi:hypothetical protein